MATLQESFNNPANIDGYLSSSSTQYLCQTFTTVVGYTITSVKLWLFKTGTPGNLAVSITATDGSGKPTGGDLASTTINGNSLTTDNPPAKTEITFDVPVVLTIATKYAIVIKSVSNSVNWSTDGSSPSYTGGAVGYKTTGAWTLIARDALFETWGNASTVYAEGTVVTSVDANSILINEALVMQEGTKSTSITGSAVLATDSYQDTHEWPLSRLSDYDSDAHWDEETEAWITSDVGAGRYKEQVVVVGQGDANQGEIYFGSV